MVGNATGLATTGIILAALAAGSLSLAETVVPTQQSDCEIAANRFKARHPRADPFDYFQHGFFFFGGTPSPEPPAIYRDAATGVAFHVESDGRHIAAIDEHGRTLWIRNPFVDVNLCPYRTAHPYIYRIGAPDFWATAPADVNARIARELNNEIDHGRKAPRPGVHARFISIEFNSSQSGYVNIGNGYFYLMSQN